MVWNACAMNLSTVAGTNVVICVQLCVPLSEFKPSGPCSIHGQFSHP